MELTTIRELFKNRDEYLGLKRSRSADGYAVSVIPRHSDLSW